MNLQLTDTGMKFYDVTSNVLQREECVTNEHIIVLESKEYSSFKTAITRTPEDIKTLLDIGFIEIKKD